MSTILRTFPIVALLLVANVAPGQTGPQLVLDGEIQTTPAVPVPVPLDFVSHGHAITAIAFLLELDLDHVGFDPADDDGDGVPDAVTFPQGAPGLTFVEFGVDGARGEIAVLLANLSGLPFPDGPLMEIEMLPVTSGWLVSRTRFSRDPAPSFGDATGTDIPGTATVAGAGIFADGFESGDLGAWTGSNVGEVPPSI